MWCKFHVDQTTGKRDLSHLGNWAEIIRDHSDFGTVVMGAKGCLTAKLS